MRDVGEKIRAPRWQSGLTLEEVSARCGPSISFLSQVERGISSTSTVTKAADQPQIRIANSAVSYRYLIVRVAGYSDYFCDLGEVLQDEAIARTKHGSF